MQRHMSARVCVRERRSVFAQHTCRGVLAEVADIKATYHALPSGGMKERERRRKEGEIIRSWIPLFFSLPFQSQ